MDTLLNLGAQIMYLAGQLLYSLPDLIYVASVSLQRSGRGESLVIFAKKAVDFWYIIYL